MKFQDLLLNPVGIRIALTFGHLLPPFLGYPLAEFVSSIVASRKNSQIVKAVRLNQFVVSGETLEGKSLDDAVKAVFKANGRSLFDFYHNIKRPNYVIKHVKFHESFQKVFDRCKRAEEGTLIVIPHISNFEMAGRAIALSGLFFQILSVPEPGKGYQWQNELRNSEGMTVTPLTPSALRQATQRLRDGGAVLTGLDRPWPESNYCPKFFGRPAPLPVAYTRLALKENVPVFVVACLYRGKGMYELIASEAIRLIPNDDLREELISNTEKILSEAEKMIASAPDQWAMFYPVWPELLDQMK